MKSYSVVKENAQIFANRKQKPVYIAKAKRNNHYKIEFENKTTKNHEIIEVVRPQTERTATNEE